MNFHDCYSHGWRAVSEGTSSEVPNPCPYCEIGALKTELWQLKEKYLDDSFKTQAFIKELKKEKEFLMQKIIVMKIQNGEVSE